MPVLQLTLGFVFGALFALVGTNEKDYLSVLRFLREPRKVSKRLKRYCRARKQAIKMTELSPGRDNSSVISLKTVVDAHSAAGSRMSYDLESLPSLCSSDSESDGDAVLMSPQSSLELQFLSFWDQPGLSELAP